MQRDDLNRINPSSLNTLRTIVLYENKKARIVAILLRIGRKGVEVDNSGQGGISVEVNLADGTFLVSREENMVEDNLIGILIRGICLRGQELKIGMI